MESHIFLKDIAKGLNNISWDILSMLKANEKLSYGNIKDKLNISQNKVSKELARLEGALLIDSKRDEVDARVYVFTLTENGFKILDNK
ncbi:winged helix DNA-binding protein [Clostridium botulinum]|uniref:winged helix DNA-binding protein n=1 Tax=Clostridium botulinum TaxID=1491 RepID=UPI0004CFEE7A|nr:winged helix DNA-binding protein [Clostridium botulinum]